MSSTRLISASSEPLSETEKRSILGLNSLWRQDWERGKRIGHKRPKEAQVSFARFGVFGFGLDGSCCFVETNQRNDVSFVFPKV